MKLALFDFDGTISDSDSFLLFMRKVSLVRFLTACVLLFPKILLYIVKKYPNQKLKEEFLVILFKGKHVSFLENQAQYFCSSTIDSIIRPRALEQIREYQKNGDKVVVVTASPRMFLEPWCERIGVEILGTELQFDVQGCATGKIDGVNCMRAEKVRRIEENFSLKEFESIFVYGDSSGDLEMLALTSTANQHYKPFR